MTHDIITAIFCVTVVANVVALIRHWRMMRVLNITLNNLIETQREFDAMIKQRPPITSPGGSTVSRLF